MNKTLELFTIQVQVDDVSEILRSHHHRQHVSRDASIVH